jgi:hypothetical protein
MIALTIIEDPENQERRMRELCLRAIDNPLDA